MNTASATLTSRAEVIEQVMRLTGDDLLADAFSRVAPGSRDFFTALGRLLSETGASVPPGSPLHRWSSSAPLEASAAWRETCPQSPSSLWGELELLRTLQGRGTHVDPLSELLELRGAA